MSSLNASFWVGDDRWFSEKGSQDLLYLIAYCRLSTRELFFAFTWIVYEYVARVCPMLILKLIFLDT